MGCLSFFWTMKQCGWTWSFHGFLTHGSSFDYVPWPSMARVCWRVIVWLLGVALTWKSDLPENLLVNCRGRDPMCHRSQEKLKYQDWLAHTIQATWRLDVGEHHFFGVKHVPAWNAQDPPNVVDRPKSYTSSATAPWLIKIYTLQLMHHLMNHKALTSFKT